MSEALRAFTEVAGNPYEKLEEWKERSGKKVIGVFPMHVPEEIIHASGMLPVLLWESDEAILLGHSRIMPYNCALSRSLIDDLLKHRIDFLDGLVFNDTCLQARGMPFIFSRNSNFGYMQAIYLPPMLPSPAARGFLVQNLRKLKSGVENFSGREISDEALRNSIKVYNRNRGLLRQLYQMRREKPGLLRAKEVTAVVRSSMSMLKEEHNELMEQLLADLKKKEQAADRRVKIHLSGAMCQAPRSDMLDLMEDVGMAIIDDDLWVGSRYFANEVAEGGDPIEALADRFLKRLPPCPTKVDWETDWGDYLVDRVKGNGAQGVVTLIVKYCPPHLCYYPDVKRKLVAAAIPEIYLEHEHEAVSLEGTRTRLEALLESI